MEYKLLPQKSDECLICEIFGLNNESMNRLQKYYSYRDLLKRTLHMEECNVYNERCNKINKNLKK